MRLATAMALLSLVSASSSLATGGQNPRQGSQSKTRAAPLSRAAAKTSFTAIAATGRTRGSAGTNSMRQYLRMGVIDVLDIFC